MRTVMVSTAPPTVAVRRIDIVLNFDCTIKPSETIRLSVSGTDAAAAWAVADASVLSISVDGLITPAKVGTTTVTATVGGAVLTITVRIK